MMSTYLYCLLTPAEPARLPRELPGLGGAHVRALVTTEGNRVAIEAWVSTIQDPPDRGDTEVAREVLAHHAVVQRALGTGRTPLPARFGQRFADDESCRADVARRGPTLAPAFARVAGSVQMRIIITPRRAQERGDPPPLTIPGRDAPHAGRQYLEALHARAVAAEATHARLAEQLDRVDVAVRPLMRESRRRELDPGALARIGTTMHLVPRDTVDAYRAALDQLVLAPEWRIVIAGPEPPYDFVDPERPPGHDSGPRTSADQ